MPARKEIQILRLKHFIFILALLVPFQVQAQLLWKISGNGVAKPSYLFATNRLTDITFLDTIPNLFATYSRCDNIITEFAIEDYEAIAALRTAALLPDTVSAEDFLTPDQIKQLDVALQLTLEMSFHQLARLKPQYIIELYRNELFNKWLNAANIRPANHFFEEVANQQGKPVIPLDDIGEALYMMFDREPIYWQYEQLMKIIDYPEVEVRLEKNIRNLYKEGRLLDMAFLISAPDNTATLSFSDYKVFCSRNKEWVRRLRPHLLKGNAFIPIDAMYLGGDDGLIALLRADGYRVKPLNKPQR